MNKSIIRVVSGKQNVKPGLLTLTADLIEGKPEAGDLIFLREHFFSVHAYSIKKVKKPLFGSKYEIVVEFPEMEWMWKDRIEKHILTVDDTVFCGIGREVYHSKSNEEKVAYFFSILETLGKGRVPQYIKEQIKFSLVLMPNEDTNSGGLSKLGGLPMAPKDFKFPIGSDGRSSLFIGQLHIKELHEYFSTSREFAGDGVLYFFGTVVKDDEFHSYGDISVKYVENEDEMELIKLPTDLEEYGILQETDMFIAEVLNIPPSESSLWEGEDMDDEERNSYHHLEGLLSRYNMFYGSKVLGHPHQIQGCVLLETEFKHENKGWYDPSFNSDNDEEFTQQVREATPSARRWRVLFEMDGDSFRELSNFQGSFNEYNDGRYYVMIRQEDLDQMDFSKTVTIYQCT